MGRIVVIEDEPGIADFVARALIAGELSVAVAHDGRRGLELALGGGVDLVILDLMLPLVSGEDVLRTLADQRPGLPVIVLTARGEVADRVNGLRAGAVDYLVKPFALAELDARVRSQLRQSRLGGRTTLHVGGLGADLLTRRVTHDGHPLRLTRTEFDLLAHFMHNPGRLLSRQELLSAVWRTEHDPGTNLVDVYVGYVRRKLGHPDRSAVTITTLRRRGYRLERAM